MARKWVTIDGNEAAAYSAHKVNEICAIYPITPSSNMGEWADEWSAKGLKNIWGTVPKVVEMQSEGGASAAAHGALQTGALTTTFTASQGLLLMIPSMFKIAGELTSTVFHVSARTIATHALSIFGDHSDINAVRSTGWGMLAAANPQEVMDMALIAQAATLEARVPFVHFFDGFRTSHEIQKIEQLADEDYIAMMDDDLVREHRARGMNPDKPVLRGSSQNPDVFFQARETINKYYDAVPEIVQKSMDKFAGIVGRQYHLFDYYGHPEAERVITIMASAGDTTKEAVEYLLKSDEKVGVLIVRLYRPFSSRHFIEALPKSVKKIGVLDRTKEPGAVGEPMFMDMIAAIEDAYFEGYAEFEKRPVVVGGRYGLSSKEFTPAMVKGVFDELKNSKPKHRFTVGINDDVTFNSIDYDPNFTTEPESTTACMFYGLGSDGTVGANKNSIKIIGEGTDFNAQGYFVYDSKKAGAVTVSHLRFGKEPIHSTYLVNHANFIACHQTVFLERYDMLAPAKEGAVFLLNTPYNKDEIWDTLPQQMQHQIVDRKLKFYVIDAYEVAKNTGMGVRINTIMQTCFFAISGVLPRDEAIGAIKNAIKKTYGKKGELIVQMNFKAVDDTIANLYEVDVTGNITSTYERPLPVPEAAPDYVKDVLGKIISGDGDSLPVSAFPVDGTFMTGTTQWEKRNIALDIPVFEPDSCIQCGKCVLVCPHAAIRAKVYDPKFLDNAPPTYKSMDYKGKEFPGMKYTIQVAPEDCTGCQLCVEVCPAKDKKDKTRFAINMAPQIPLRESEAENYEFFLNLPEVNRASVKTNTVKGIQFLQPLFEYSGACAGCGETPYVKLMSQLFGDRAVIGNATGCSSIYGGNLPTTPWTVNNDGRGPTWNNSLFEDCAEFGLGFRLTIDKQNEYAKELLIKMKSDIGAQLVDDILVADQSDEAGIKAQRDRMIELDKKLFNLGTPDALNLASVSNALVKKSVWSVGGDGWAYDIGYGGLDHVLASGQNVNLLVLDTGVYSNTGGQCSKATPLGAVAKFAEGGKQVPRKDLGMLAMGYGTVYVAQVAMGMNDAQCVKAFLEAEAYDGPSLIIAYSQCIAHGIDMAKGMHQQKLVVQSGAWPMYRYNPDLRNEGKNPLSLDSKPPKIDVGEWAMSETRFKMLDKMDPELTKTLLEKHQKDVDYRWSFYEHLAKMDYNGSDEEEK
ncbi:MAG: pyruvate:ferredoxin (flavodoxin) oxidoreductase [Candidatus Electryonea clarkiae]|nr:pyruvate:ferredoxin (flavodoxin) oxidoreductase [Candidatus Electryonea clarkiae]MDP8289296.1 pyruvate:ferredoxin (flavodoxin) oxidoreductase [Candidatus Electryonea clarkiae]